MTKSVDERYGTYEKSAPYLMPRLIDRWRVSQLEANAPDARLASFVVGDYFAIVAAVDTPQSKTLVHSEMLKAWEVPFAEVFDQAYKNLYAKTAGESQFETFMDKETGKAACYGSLWNDNYDAARILFAEGSRFQGLDVNGATLVALTNNQLIIFGTNDNFGAAVALSKIETAREQPDALPPMVLILGADGRWTRYRFPNSHPLCPGFLRAEISYLNTIYLQQTDLLNAQMEQSDGQFFIAPFVAAHSLSGEASSYCALIEGVPTLLPKTEFINFVRVNDDTAHEDDHEDGELLATGQWDAVAQVLGDRIQKTNDFPPRYMVVAFPSTGELERIGKQPMFKSGNLF